MNNLLKLNPGNTELLAQKNRLLTEAVEKLETLKAAAEQANEALAKGEITQEQYDGLQREIIEIEEKLKNLENQANQSAVAIQKVAATGEDLKNLGDKISGVGTTLTKGVTTPIVGLGIVAVKTAADFDTAMSQVAAVSGATGSDLDALRDKEDYMEWIERDRVRIEELEQSRHEAQMELDRMQEMAGSEEITDGELAGLSVRKAFDVDRLKTLIEKAVVYSGDAIEIVWKVRNPFDREVSV